MGLAFIPLYIRYLGMEAYGLIGLFGVLQASLTLLDIGMTPTLNREMARYTAGAHSPQSIRDLLRSIEILCISIAAVIALGLSAASEYIASDWLKPEKLPVDAIAQSLWAMALAVALLFVEGIYRGSLLGLQQQAWYNGAGAVLSTLRHGGAILVLAWISPTIVAYFLWQAAISLLALMTYGLKVHRALPAMPAPPKFSLEALSGTWRFATGMMGITFLALLLTQMDKVLLSYLLTLESFGFYTLAGTVAGVLYMVVGPITQAVFPRMVELHTGNDSKGFTAVYHQGAQAVIVVSAPIVMLLAFFAGDVVFVWTADPELARNTAPILSALALGTFLNVLFWMPYHCQLAHGWTSLALKVNSVAVLILVPAILWVVPRHGAVGAAWIWVALNLGYVLVGVQLMHARLLPDEKGRWYISDVMLPTAGAMVVAVLARHVQPISYQDRWQWLVFFLTTAGLATAASAALADVLRSRVLSLIQLHRHRRYS